MARILSTVHLSDMQKVVLAAIKAAPTPQLAYEQLTKGPQSIDSNIAGARDVLMDLGLITMGEGTVEITPKGDEVMQEEYLVDETGELTPQTRELLSKAFPDDQPEQPPAEDQGLSLESFSLLRKIHNSARIKEDMKLIEMMGGNPQQIMHHAKLFLNGDVDFYDLDEETQDALIRSHESEMPYGAITGDDDTPDNWLLNQDPREVLTVLQQYLSRASR